MCLGVFFYATKSDTTTDVPRPSFANKINYETANAFEIYETMRKKILLHAVNLEDMDVFGIIIKDDKELGNIQTSLESLHNKQNQDEIYETLYRQFIKASPDTDILYHYLKKELFRALDKADNNVEHRGNYYAWSWAYGARAAVLAYMASKEERFLDLIVCTYDVILRNRDSDRNKFDVVRGRVLNSWGTSTKKHARGKWTNVVTTAGRITYPVSMFCKIVFNDEELHHKYLDKAEEYLETIKKAVGEFNEDFKIIPGTDEGYFRRLTDKNVEPLNHAHAAGNTFVMLYLITGQEKYRKKAEYLARFFLSSVSPEENGSYAWAYQPSPEDRKGNKAEPVWKGAITISFPILAYRHGFVFEEDDIRAITDTFLKNIYRGDNAFNVYISSEMLKPLGPKIVEVRLWTRIKDMMKGNFKTKTYSISKGYMRSLALWMFLDVYAPEIRSIIEDAVAARRDIFEKGWFQTAKMALAYSHRFQTLQ